MMPKGTTAKPREANIRGRYAAQACNICRARKSKCDGVKPSCGSCTGRGDECSWGRDPSHRKPRTEAHFEALRKRADALQAYVNVLEGMLAKCICQDVSGHLKFRPGDDPGRKNVTPMDSDNETLDPGDDITQELCLPTQSLKLDDEHGGLLRYGIAAPFRFATGPSSKSSQFPEVVVRDSNTSYVLLVEGVSATAWDLTIDWSRHLPPEVPLTRKQHDNLLDLFFKFFTVRVVPSLFLRDMYRALSVPTSHRPPKTPNYSPMLHNALMALATAFSDDPHLRDEKSREYFVAAAKGCLEAQCQKPDVSLVLGLGLVGTYYADLGAVILGEAYFGMSARISQALGLTLDASAWVRSGLITNDEMIGRNYAYWTIFVLDVCWALYFGREMPEGRNPPMPLVSSEADQLPWHYPPANIPPQPNYISLIFSASTSLFLVARKIVQVLEGLGHRDSPRQAVVYNDRLITQIDLELNSWRSQLSPVVDITTPGNRAKSTPHRLMLHCMYWWLFILLHRPFFNRRPRAVQVTDREMDHVKLCKRSAENIMELLETYSKLYTLRYVPVTLVQVIFSAGTVFLLLSLQATLNLRIAHQALKTSLSQAELCVQYLYEIGKSWRGAARAGDILSGLLDTKLKPILMCRCLLAEQHTAVGQSNTNLPLTPAATDDSPEAAPTSELPPDNPMSFHPTAVSTRWVSDDLQSLHAPQDSMDDVWTQAQAWEFFSDPSANVPNVLNELVGSFAPPMFFPGVGMGEPSGVNVEFLPPTFDSFGLESEGRMFEEELGV